VTGTAVSATAVSATAAIATVGLDPSQRIADLVPGSDEWTAFRRLVGWDPGGPVIEPTDDERAARRQREAWKSERLGRRRGRSLLYDDDGLARARRALANSSAPAWLTRLIDTARQVADLGAERLCALVPARAPWNTAGSYCPACVGQRSDVSIHSPPWRWSIDEPTRIACPVCDTSYPHADYPEEGRLELPRLGLRYEYYLPPSEDPSTRDGEGASSFGGGPTHVSLSGEAERCALNWVLGQLEPMALAAAVTDDTAMAAVVRTVLQRLADVYPGYPLYTYRQEYYDCDPAWAVERREQLPAPFRRAACRYTYDGSFGDRRALHGRGDSTLAACLYPNAEWGCSRMAREKASHGQLFLTLLQAWDLVADGASAEQAAHIEGELLLEYYLDVTGLTGRVDNKSGPGTAARVAAGLMWRDEEQIGEGVERYRRLLAGQFYDDGSWKETPIYGAKALVEGLWMVPELLRHRGLYDEPLLRRAFQVYAATATPCGTQPALDDSAADFSLPAQLRDLARLRTGVHVPAAPADLRAFGPTRSGHAAFSGYVARIDMTPDDASRRPWDGGLGFHAVGHHVRQAPETSWVSLLCGEAPTPPHARAAASLVLRGRGLVCLGLGAGEKATQVYLDGGDGRRGHRHRAPLSLMGFHGGREVLPDLGYIADHPANAWIRATASHNTVVVDGRSVESAGRCDVAAFVRDPAFVFADVRLPVRLVDSDETCSFRRAVLLLADGPGRALLVDVFDATGRGPFHWVCRGGAPDGQPVLSGVGDEQPMGVPFGQDCATPPRHGRRLSLTGAITVAWPGEVPVGASILRPGDESGLFEAPAWRTAAEAFAAPGRAWTAVTCRQAGPAARFVAVLALGGEPPVVENLGAENPGAEGDVRLRIDGARRHIVTVGEARGTVEQP
jgi:hypothetical protein